MEEWRYGDMGRKKGLKVPLLSHESLHANLLFILNTVRCNSNPIAFFYR